MWENLSRVLEEYIIEVKAIYQDNLSTEGKVASGDLLNNINYIIEKDDRQIEVSLKLEDYWKYVEYGREPGKFPPQDKIMEWIKVKPVLPRQINGKLPTPEQLSFLIGRKIAEEGIEPTNILEHSIETVNNRFEQKIMDAINDDISNMVDVVFSEYFK